MIFGQLDQFDDSPNTAPLHECQPASYPSNNSGVCWTVPWNKPRARCVAMAVRRVITTTGYELRECA